MICKMVLTMENDTVLDLELAKNIIRPAQATVFYLDFDRMSLSDETLKESRGLSFKP